MNEHLDAGMLAKVTGVDRGEEVAMPAARRRRGHGPLPAGAPRPRVTAAGRFWKERPRREGGELGGGPCEAGVGPCGFAHKEPRGAGPSRAGAIAARQLAAPGPGLPGVGGAATHQDAFEEVALLWRQLHVRHRG